MVTVTSSSLMPDSEPLSSFVVANAKRCVTKPQYRPWMSINLKNVKIKF